MARPIVTLPIKSVISVCAMHPAILPDIRKLTHTGKRGRPASTVKMRDVLTVIKANKDARFLTSFVRNLI